MVTRGQTNRETAYSTRTRAASLWLVVSRQLTYYPDKMTRLSGNTGDEYTEQGVSTIMGVTSDAPSANREWGGAAEKTLRYSLRCVYFHTFPWESKPLIRKDEERRGCQLLPDEQPPAFHFKALNLFPAYCSARSVQI